MLFNEHADVSVRPAIESDAPKMATIQVESWTQALSQALGNDTLLSLNIDAISEQWTTTIQTPPGPGFAVFTALAAHEVVGFCAVSPASIVAFEVSPSHQRQGHGSRLLSAAIDRIQRDGSSEAGIWIPESGTAKQQFFASAGFADIGRVRHLKIDEDRELLEQRWATDLSAR